VDFVILFGTVARVFGIQRERRGDEEQQLAGTDV
jgi:hypothetical protein